MLGKACFKPVGLYVELTVMQHFACVSEFMLVGRVGEQLSGIVECGEGEEENSKYKL